MSVRTFALALPVALGLVIATAREAGAFPTGEQFDMDPVKEDGAGGIAFDGALRWSGHTCAVCHTNPPGRVGLRLEADHPEVFTDGWKAGQQYHLRVVLENEWAAVIYRDDGDNCGFSVTPYHPCDENGFALEMDDVRGKPLGKFAAVVGTACATGTPPTDAAIRVLADGTAVTHTGAHMGQTSWDLCWTAPGAGAGTITAFVAAVDGNGGNGTADFPNDTTGDDVAAGAVPLPEAGAGTPSPQGGGCSAAGSLDLGAVVLVLLVMVARRRRRGVAVLLAIAALAGCTHVRPRQRETLAKKNMKFAPDPTEDELDLHMQESREGSSGGYGSSGGGCGCN